MQWSDQRLQQRDRIKAFRECAHLTMMEAVRNATSLLDVPLSVDLHALSLRQLIRAVKRERGAVTLANAKTA